MRETQNPYGGGYGGPGGYGPPPGGYGPPHGGYGPPPPGPGGYGPPPGGYGPPPAGSFGGAPGPGGPTGPRTDTLGIVGLVCSILGIVGAIVNAFAGAFGTCCVICTLGSTFLGAALLIPSLAGAVMGGMSVKRIADHPQHLTGKGIAMAALVIGLVSSLLVIAEIVLPWLGIACFAASGAAGP